MPFLHPLLILLGDGGVGKSRLVTELPNRDHRVRIVKCDTTRAQRTDQERARLDELIYHFLTRRRFIRNRTQDPYAFDTEQMNELYGTRKSEVERIIAHRAGILSMVPSAIERMRSHGYPVRVVWVDAIDHQDTRSEERRAFDEIERTVSIDIDFSLVNSHAPGGLDRTLTELSIYIDSLS